MTIGQRIKQRRQELGMTQMDLAVKLGNSSRASVCTVEKDREDMTMDRIRKYAEALNCEPGYLAGWLRTPTRESENDIKARELYEKYSNASPEVRAAIELLLKSPQ